MDGITLNVAPSCGTRIINIVLNYTILPKKFITNLEGSYYSKISKYGVVGLILVQFYKFTEIDLILETSQYHN